MIRSSSSYRICTNRPSFDDNVHEGLLNVVKVKVQKMGQVFRKENLDDYCETKGMMGDAKKLKTSFTNKYLAENDPLPDGAKTYLQERWLELNYNFHDMSTSDSTFSLAKGNLAEDDAIEVLCMRYGEKGDHEKNTVRKTMNFITGECDLHYANTIRDIKVPESWKSFRSKQGITAAYRWQLISYCYLYGASKAYLDYVLMPTPEVMIPNLTKNFSERELENFWETEEAIKALPLKQRVKTYELETDLQADIDFLVSRLQKAEEYYETLTYEECMKMI